MNSIPYHTHPSIHPSVQFSLLASRANHIAGWRQKRLCLALTGALATSKTARLVICTRGKAYPISLLFGYLRAVCVCVSIHEQSLTLQLDREVHSFTQQGESRKRVGWDPYHTAAYKNKYVHAQINGTPAKKHI